MSDWFAAEPWRARFAAAQETIEKSPILSLSLPAIGVILVLYLIAMIEDANTERAANFNALLRQEASHQSVEAQADWTAVLARERERLGALDEQAWRAESVELASADVQSALRNVALERLTSPRIEVADPVRLARSDRWLIRASLTGRAHRDQLPALLAALTSRSPRLMTERFNYFPDRGDSIDLQVLAIFEIGADS